MEIVNTIMNYLTTAVTFVNKYMWDYILLYLLCGTGIYFTFRLKFIQVRKFKKGVKRLFSCFNLNGEKAGEDGMSSFQALTTAIAAQVGTGNIAGAATAIASGGPGAIFWMWVSAFFGMATIYAEALLAQRYKSVDKKGAVTGGPVFYIKAAFKGNLGKFLAAFFSIAIIIALGFMGNMVQSNSIGTSFATAFGVKPIYLGIICSITAAIIFCGGNESIAWITEKIVPIMAFLYIIGCSIVLILNYTNIPQAFSYIFTMAFQPQSVAGGVAGIGVQQAMRFGVARGLFSNEAGMGSTPHAHAIAKVEHPTDQGVIAMISVFIDTFIILTLTALVIMTTGAWKSNLTGAALAQSAFSQAFGCFGNIFIAICMLFFAFSTIIGWYFFGKTNVKSLLGDKYVKFYSAIVCLFIAVGSCLKVELVWDLSDMFNGLMVLPNLLALIALSSIVVKISREKD